MCGICGFGLSANQLDRETLLETAGRMADTMTHRGPDDSGTWADAAAGIAFGFRRLSIQDLSEAGKQPMDSPCGRYVIVFNGEIYNFRELTSELGKDGARFRGHSDTEVLLTALSRWGLEAMLRRIDGMFAFALWDRETRRLTLARDRAGKKPLYYGWSGGTFLFGSELKALRAHPGFRAEIDRRALSLFLQYSWVPAPFSIYRGVRKLPAGTFLTLDLEREGQEAEPIIYWSARAEAERGLEDPFAGTEAEAEEALQSKLERAVRQRMIADVSLGALLSGGIDSSLVVALMQLQSDRPVKTFTIGFHEEKYDEAPHAAAVAGHLGTDHNELYINAQDCLDLVPRIPALYDEPFGDSSQIPTFLVSKLARSQVTVALTGDGGDELFAGYAGYRRCLEWWDQRAARPEGVNRALGAVLGVLSNAADGTGRLEPLGRIGANRLAAKMRRRSATLAAADPVDLYARKRLRCEEKEGFVLGGGGAACLLSDPETWKGFDDPLVAMTYLDYVTYLADDILVKVDRASMGVSLEVRSPLLDREVTEFAWRLPVAMKFGPDGGKRILRRILARHVPPALFERPKSGFGIPIGKWLTGPLREWTETLLDRSRLSAEGYLNPAAVSQAWRQQLSGQRNRERLIWNLLVFQSWLDAEQHALNQDKQLHAVG